MTRLGKIRYGAPARPPAGGGNDTAVLCGAVAVVGDVGRVNRLSMAPLTTEYMTGVLILSLWIRSQSGALTGPHVAMSDSSSLYVPRSVAELVDDVHRREGRPCDPKWRTVERAVSEFSGDNGGTDE